MHYRGRKKNVYLTYEGKCRRKNRMNIISDWLHTTRIFPFYNNSANKYHYACVELCNCAIRLHSYFRNNF